MGFAQKLEKVMKEKQITKYRLAKDLNVHQSTVKNWVDGHTIPKFDMIERIAAVLEVHYTKLLYSDDFVSDVMDFGKRVQIKRKQKTMSQKDLANAVGVTQSVIVKYENGTDIPSWEMIDKIAAAFDISRDELLYNVNALSYDKNELEKMISLQQLLIDDIQAESEEELLKNFNKLNSIGKKEAVKRTAELSEIPKYTKPE